MKSTQRVQGKALEIHWREEDGRISFAVNLADQPGNGSQPGLDSPWKPASVIEVEHGIYSVLVEGRSYDVRLEHAHYGDFAQVGPWRVLLEPDARGPRAGAAASGGPAKVLSRMPGRVVRVLVADGDAVTEGQGLLVLEAMKMQNEITAPRAGTVLGLAVAEGDVVAAGILLCRVE